MAGQDRFESEVGMEGAAPECAVCEQMLSEAAEGLLGEAEGRWFRRHVAGCARCGQAWAEEQQGAAWLAVLKAERLELPVGLVERIVAKTSGAEMDERIPAVVPASVQGVMQGFPPLRGGFAAPVAWGRPVDRVGAWFEEWWGRLMGEPRLAMTAAMALFSIALTLNLLGVRLDEVHARDLRLETLRRGYFTASARTEQFYDNLRVVHVMESGVRGLRDARENGGGDRKQEEPRPADGGSSRWERPAGGKDLVAGGRLETAPELRIEDGAEVRS